MDNRFDLSIESSLLQKRGVGGGGREKGGGRFYHLAFSGRHFVVDIPSFLFSSTFINSESFCASQVSSLGSIKCKQNHANSSVENGTSFVLFCYSPPANYVGAYNFKKNYSNVYFLSVQEVMWIIRSVLKTRTQAFRIFDFKFGEFKSKLILRANCGQ